MSTDPDWLDIPKIEFEIRGLDGSSIHFASESVLAKRILLTGIVSFTTTLTVRTTHSTFQHSFQLVDYNGLRPFRDSLSAIRNGTGESASMTGAGFSLTIGLHTVGTRRGLLVQGHCSSVSNLEDTPWPVRQPICDFVLLNSESAGCIHFAFLSSLVDPPYIDATIAQIDHILRFLEGEGFQP